MRPRGESIDRELLAKSAEGDDWRWTATGTCTCCGWIYQRIDDEGWCWGCYQEKVKETEGVLGEGI